ncbi:uncharacterized protein LOC120781632 isoform X1 [Bactrocera tryoni]|uniref:uncharacterized protein LOC120781632 isoform X1 n=1 Tax=Bactrocera tryoni TaxID=59916 RepID=UPI001A965205|nr:uncharacterized protein LOC120781632 isoform X1 [Bactrocera tryoni]
MIELHVKFNTIWYIVLIISSISTGIKSGDPACCFVSPRGITRTYVSKMSPIKNHFMESSQSHFSTKNSTRVIAQKGGLAVLPCVVKLNSPATVSIVIICKHCTYKYVHIHPAQKISGIPHLNLLLI